MAVSATTATESAATRMLTFTNDQLRQKLADEAGADASGIDFLPFSDLDESVRASVRRIQESRLLPDSFAASGFVFDVGAGRLREVEVASALGAHA